MSLGLEVPGRPTPQAPDADMPQPPPLILKHVHRPLHTRMPPPANTSPTTLSPSRAIHGATTSLPPPQMRSLGAVLNFRPPRLSTSPTCVAGQQASLLPPRARTARKSCSQTQQVSQCLCFRAASGLRRHKLKPHSSSEGPESPCAPHPSLTGLQPQ